MVAHPIEHSNAAGLLHREDGPAIERANGDKYWYINGLRHREDGPAVELADGTKKWYINGEEVEAPPSTKSSNKQ